MHAQGLEKKSQSPLYQQLMTRLRNDILAGAYPSGGRIPSEQVLCDTYSVSRVTVRKALFDLVQEGLLIRRQGKGTFVAGERIERDLQTITSFSAECERTGRSVATKVISAQRTSSRPEDAQKLSLEPGSELIELCRVRISDDEPVMLEYNYFPPKYDFLLSEPLTGSLYELLRRHGLIPSHAEHYISLGHASQLVSKHLVVPVGEAVLVLDEVVYDQHEQPLHVSKQWIRGDRFTFRI